MITDNSFNMVKVKKLMNELTRFSCAIHTLQLIVKKGLIPAKVLITRVKRLINFFTSPKQTEKLLDIQKNTNHNNNEVQ